MRAMTVREASSASFFSWAGAGERVNRRAGGGGGVKLASWEPTDSTIVGQQTARRLSQNTQKGLWSGHSMRPVIFWVSGKLEIFQKSKKSVNNLWGNLKMCSKFQEKNKKLKTIRKSKTFQEILKWGGQKKSARMTFLVVGEVKTSRSKKVEEKVKCSHFCRSITQTWFKFSFLFSF